MGIVGKCVAPAKVDDRSSKGAPASVGLRKQLS